MATTTLSQVFSKDWKLVLAERKKFVAYLATALGLVVDAGVAHGSALRWVGFAILALGAFGVHGIKNS